MASSLEFIEQRMNALLAVMEEAPDDETLPEEVAAELTRLVEAEAAKVDSIGRLLEEYEARSNAAKERSRQLSERAKRFENRAKRLKEFVKMVLQQSGLTRVEGNEFTITVAKGPQKVELADGTVLPDEYMRTPPPPEKKPDALLLLSALKAGVVVEGASLTRSTFLRVKR